MRSPNHLSSKPMPQCNIIIRYSPKDIENVILGLLSILGSYFTFEIYIHFSKNRKTIVSFLSQCFKKKVEE